MSCGGRGRDLEKLRRVEVCNSELADGPGRSRPMMLAKPIPADLQGSNRLNSPQNTPLPPKELSFLAAIHAGEICSRHTSAGDDSYSILRVQ